MERLSFKILWGVIMVIIFLAMFIMLIFTDLFKGQLLVVRYFLGIIFLLYAAFRGWQIIHLLKNSKNP